MSAEQTQGGGRERRQQRRVDVGLPLTVLGTDREGQAFEEQTQSANLSRTGASFVTARALEVGMEVDIIIPRQFAPRGVENEFMTRARVVRVLPGDNPREWNVGVNFLGARFHRVFVSEAT